jgi:hypothetical protein
MAALCPICGRVVMVVEHPERGRVEMCWGGHIWELRKRKGDTVGGVDDLKRAAANDKDS